MFHRTTRIAALGLVLTFALAASAAAAAEPPQGEGGVKVFRDVSYGPHPRQVLDLYLPPERPGADPAPRPLIVCIHGGGWAGGDKRAYAGQAQAFARAGFVAASITYRFAPAATAPAQMRDVERAVRWLRKRAAEYQIDPERVGAIGSSAGGHLAAWLGLADVPDDADPELAKVPARVQCVVDCFGPVDLVGMMRSASAPIVKRFVGAPIEEDEEAYRRASPITYVAKGAPPFLILHGTLDVGARPGQVPIEQSVDLAEKLRAVGADATLVKIEGAGHGFGGQNARTAHAAALEFFRKHLVKRPRGDR